MRGKKTPGFGDAPDSHANGRTLGGLARARSLTPARRKEIAQMGVEARWSGDTGPAASKPAMVECPTCGGHGKIAPEAISIGMRLLALRKAVGKTQAEVSVDLHIGRAQLANIEADRSRPGIEALVKIADLYGVSVDYLLGRG